MLCLSFEKIKLTEQSKVELDLEKYAPKYELLTERKVVRELFKSSRKRPYGWQPSVEFEQELRTKDQWYLNDILNMESNT